MRIYLAARYTRRLELCEYAQELRAFGHTVDARWLNGSHQLNNEGMPIGEDGELVFQADGQPAEAAAPLRVKLATDDYDDVLASDLLIAFTETPRSSNSRGGRHVEFGLALGAGIPVIVVGPRENVFTWLPSVTHYETWSECRLSIPRACYWVEGVRVPATALTGTSGTGQCWATTTVRAARSVFGGPVLSETFDMRRCVLPAHHAGLHRAELTSDGFE